MLSDWETHGASYFHILLPSAVVPNVFSTCAERRVIFFSADTYLSDLHFTLGTYVAKQAETFVVYTFGVV